MNLLIMKEKKNKNPKKFIMDDKKKFQETW